MSTGDAPKSQKLGIKPMLFIYLRKENEINVVIIKALVF
jgi:hypothetical protein